MARRRGIPVSTLIESSKATVAALGRCYVEALESRTHLAADPWQVGARWRTRPFIDGPSVTANLRGDRDTASAEATISNVTSTFSVTGSAAVIQQGSQYSVSLGTTGAVSQWVIDWGHGAPEVFPGTATSATHTFPLAPATYGVSVTAVDGDGQHRLDTSTAFDATFDADGKVFSSFGAKGNNPSQLLAQRDGKIVTLSTIVDGSNINRILLSRYNPDGSLDPSFGTAGRVVFTAGGSGAASAYGLALQPDGRIVISGGYRSGVVMARFLPEGSLDPSFGGTAAGGFDAAPGWVAYELGNLDVIARLALTPDGRIVGGGIAAPPGGDPNARVTMLTRFKPDGSFDPTFGSGGVVYTNISANAVGVHDVALQSDGNILVLPDIYTPTPPTLLMRFNPEGSPDSTFDGDGRVIVNLGSAEALANSMSLAPDGTILVAGGWAGSPASDSVVARLTPSGAPDPTFADGGLLHNLPAGSDSDGVVPTGMVLPIVRAMPDGRFLLGGSHELFLNRWEYLIDRYNADGTPDTGFATRGRFTVDVGGTGNAPFLTDVAFQGDGAPLLYGGAGTAFNTTEALVRLAPTALSVRVVDADVPQLAVSAPPSVDEGAAYTLGLGLGMADADGISEWIVNWGDGVVQTLPGGTPAASHVYPDGPKSVVVKVSAIDGDGTIASVLNNVTVNNVPPVIAVIGGSSVGEGSNYTVQFSATDAGADTRSGWTVDWGDGKSNSYPAITSSAQHAYLDDGTYAVTVKATDEDGTFSATPVSALITNVPPSIDLIPPRVAAAGTAMRFAFTARDAVPEVFSGSIVWGDGSPPSPFSLTTPVAVANTFTLDHTYAARGTYNVTVDLSDGDGGTAQATSSVQVGDVVVSVFDDTDGNGARGVAESPHTGVMAFLDLDRDGSFDTGEPTETTDAFGDVLFDGLSVAAAPYAARIVPPSNWHLGTPAAGFVDVTPGTASAAAATFGLTQVAAVTGTLFNDADGNGVRDVGEGAVSTTVRARRLDTGATTGVSANASGVYRFNALQPGPYVIELTTSARTITAPAARRGYLITVTGAETEFAGLDIGSRTGTGASVFGTLYRDLNGNGMRDAGEPASPNQTLYVDANDNGRRDADEWIAISDSTGAYGIGRLPTGTFRVRQDLPPGAPVAADPSVSRLATTTFGQQTTGVDLARPYEKTYYVLLSVTGSITVYNGSQISGSMFAQIAPNNATLYTLPASTSDDWVILDWTFGSPIPAGGFKVDGLAGNDTLSVVGSFGADAMTFSAGSIARTGNVPATYTGVERVTFDGQGGWDDVSVAGGPAVTFGGTQYLQSLSVAAGASVVVAPGGTSTLVARGLSVDGTLDLTNNSMVAKNGSLPAVQASIAAGFNHGAWNGTMGITSSAAASDASGLTAIGYAINADLNKPSFAGVTGLASSDVLVKYTYYGDANLDGQVDIGDLGLLAGAWQQTWGKSWFDGDFTYDGKVDIGDLGLLAGNWQKGVGNPI